METVTKAELARRLGVTSARVSQYVAAGLPVRADGRVNAARAIAWVRARYEPARGGWIATGATSSCTS